MVSFPWIKIPLRIWHRLGNENEPTKEPDWILRWIGYDSDFLPNRTDARFKQRADRGLTKHSHLYEGGTLRQFQDLKNCFALSFYRFLQLRHNVEKIMRKEELRQTHLGRVKIFVLGYRSDPGRGNMSKI